MTLSKANRAQEISQVALLLGLFSANFLFPNFADASSKKVQSKPHKVSYLQNFKFEESPNYLRRLYPEALTFSHGEISEVKGLLLKIEIKEPRLLNLATDCGASIHIIKAALPIGEYCNAGPNYILISPAFFTKPNRLHMLIHELVHLTDRGRSFSYHTEWVRICQTEIPKIRLLKEFCNVESQTLADSYIVKNSPFHSVYAGRNLRESIAEFVTYSIEANYHNHFVNSFLNRSEADRKWHNYFKAGEIAYQKGEDCDFALRQFEMAERINQNPLFLHFFLCMVFSEKGLLKEACRHGELCREKIDALEITDLDSISVACRRELGLAYEKSNQLEKAINTYNQALILEPLDTSLRERKEQCLLKLRKTGISLDEFTDPIATCNFAVSAPSCSLSQPAAVRALLDKVLETKYSQDMVFARVVFDLRELLKAPQTSERAKILENCLALINNLDPETSRKYQTEALANTIRLDLKESKKCPPPEGEGTNESAIIRRHDSDSAITSESYRQLQINQILQILARTIPNKRTGN